MEKKLKAAIIAILDEIKKITFECETRTEFRQWTNWAKNWISGADRNIPVKRSRSR